MRFKKVLLLFFPFLSVCISGQFNQLLHKKYADKVIQINDFYRESMELSYPEAKNRYKELKLFGKKNNDISLQLEAELYLAYYRIYFHIGTEEAQVKNILQVGESGKKEKIFDIEARAIKVLRDYYWYDKKNYESGFEYGLQLGRLLSKTSANDFPDLPEYYYIIGSCYYLFRDYRTSIKYFKKVLEVPETSFNWKSCWNAANTLGLCYQKLNKTDSSDYYLQKAVASEFVEKESIQHSISMGNLAYNLYQKGKFSEAKPLFQTDISNAVKIEDYGLAAGSMIPLADIYIYQKKIKDARELLEKAELYIRRSGQTERYEQLYPVISHWYATQGMEETAIEYRDSAIIAANNNNNTFSGLMFLRVQQKIDAQKLETARQKFLQSEKNHRLKTILFLVFLGMVMVFTLLYYSHLRKIYKEKSKTKEAELRLSNEKLESANQIIYNFLREIENKNRIIRQLKEMDHSVQNQSAIEEIRKTVILTEEDWEKFREAFERINPGYIDRLKNKMHSITPAEIRMIVLGRLKLSHKEIASILGISPQSSRVTWHRLKKKINLEDSVSLQDLADEI